MIVTITPYVVGVAATDNQIIIYTSSIIQGGKGDTGDTGATGAVGADGADGADGAVGADGADGAVGADGAAGIDGADGLTITEVAVTITVANWDTGTTCTKAIAGITTTSANDVILNKANGDLWASSNIYPIPTVSVDGSQDFVCDTTPSEAITFIMRIVK